MKITTVSLMCLFLLLSVCSCTKGVIANKTAKDWYEDVGIAKKDDIVLVKNASKVLMALNSKNPWVRIYAANDLSLHGDSSSHFIPTLIDNCMINNEPVARASASAIKEIAGSDSSEYYAAVKSLMSSSNQQAVIYGIGLAELDQSVFLYTKDTIERLSGHSNKSISVKANGALIKGTMGKYRPTAKTQKSNNDKMAIKKTEIKPYAVAVIIGNSDYSKINKSVPNVDYAINDSKSIKMFLNINLGFDDTNIIYLENATQSELISAFGSDKSHKGKLFNWVRPGESDVFVFYSGHGAPGLNDGNGYLLPVDADPSTVELNGYPINTLYSNLSKIPAKSITVVIDACFSGNSQAGALVKSASSISLRPIDVPKGTSNMTVISATGVGEVASWDENAKHGLLTSYFLKAIDGEADKGKTGNNNQQIELEEVKKYLELEVPYMARRLYGREQHPQISGNSTSVISTYVD